MHIDEKIIKQGQGIKKTVIKIVNTHDDGRESVEEFAVEGALIMGRTNRGGESKNFCASAGHLSDIILTIKDAPDTLVAVMDTLEELIDDMAKKGHGHQCRCMTGHHCR